MAAVSGQVRVSLTSFGGVALGGVLRVADRLIRVQFPLPVHDAARAVMARADHS